MQSNLTRTLLLPLQVSQELEEERSKLAGALSEALAKFQRQEFNKQVVSRAASADPITVVALCEAAVERASAADLAAEAQVALFSHLNRLLPSISFGEDNESAVKMAEAARLLVPGKEGTAEALAEVQELLQKVRAPDGCMNDPK